MSAATVSAGKSAAIWERVIQMKDDPTPTAARALLKLQFSPDDVHRMHDLSAKARAGALGDDEREEIETFEQLGCLLDILHSRARRVLNRRPRRNR
jgi:hypothetical protein